MKTFPSYGAQPTLWALLGRWLEAELELDWLGSGGMNTHTLLQTFDKLCTFLPEYGDPEKPWVYTVDKVALHCGSEYRQASTCDDCYVNGKYVQFFGRVGRVTVRAA